MTEDRGRKTEKTVAKQLNYLSSVIRPQSSEEVRREKH